MTRYQKEMNEKIRSRKKEGWRQISKIHEWQKGNDSN
jgi:hypothetical protein